MWLAKYCTIIFDWINYRPAFETKKKMAICMAFINILYNMWCLFVSINVRAISVGLWTNTRSFITNAVALFRCFVVGFFYAWLNRQQDRNVPAFYTASPRRILFAFLHTVCFASDASYMSCRCGVLLRQLFESILFQFFWAGLHFCSACDMRACRTNEVNYGCPRQ